jgi:two-component system cell cycle sensor histidine kinase/response regulator CckA
MAQDHGIASWREVGLSRRAWGLGLALSLATLAAGIWGFMVEGPENHRPLQFLAYFVVPVLLVLALAAGRGNRRVPILAAVALLDVEAVLLGAGPLVALPFVVAVPLVGVSAAVRVLPSTRLWPPYVAGWLCSSLGVLVAVNGTISTLAPSAFIVVPCFALVDALALTFLWRLDAGRMSALSAAAEAEVRSRELLQNVDLVGIHIGADGRIDFMNDYALRLTGWVREEVLGKDWYDTFATPDRRAEARARLQKAASGHKDKELEHHRESTILTKSGEVLLIRWSHVNRHFPDGRLAGVASLGEDVTAIRAAEEEQRRGAELVSKVVGNSPLPTAVLGLDRTVQLWNPAAAELLGWSEAELVGKPMPRAFEGPNAWVIGRRFVRAIRGELLDHELVELVHRDGRALRVRLYGGALRDRDGRAIAVAVQAIDVTATLAMEERLLEAQKMEAVGRLAGGVAHDFNNSLTAIGGFASLIASESSEPESREAAQTILSATKHAADLTRELLAYSRRSMLQPQTIDVNALVGSVRPMLRRLLGEDVSVVIESRVSSAMVLVDPSGLERVILNLAANARDAMPGGGRLTIATDRLESDAPDGRSGRWIVISVADTGAGLPIELQPQVFDPFFTTKPVGSGTGLGLSMVKGFVVQSGGYVSLESGSGGTTIEILLPESTEAQVSVPEPDMPLVMGRGETVLVVEDDPTVAVMSFQVLSRRGYRVLLADTGESALALIRGHGGPIALLLSDVILPDMRGPYLAEVARKVHPEASVLYASGYSTEAIGRAGELPEDVDLIEKPYSPEELLARVREAIDRGSELVDTNELRPVPARSSHGGPTDPD